MTLRLTLLFIVCLGTRAFSQTTAPSFPKDPPAAAPDDNYPAGPDSKRQQGVPEGKTFQFSFKDSKIFPGTHRQITVYVPAQYKADKPACVYVGLDGLGFEAPVVFDNLIARGQIPVLIGIGLSPGQVESSRPGENPRFNRSYEFDGLNDNLARFVVEELIPEIEANHKTADGLPIKLSKDPNDRCAGGGSTGGIGSFTLAWERPDLFRRVFSAIGTYVGMRGGDRYPVLVRKTEPKPIRIFMQDGSNDEWMGGPEVGDWWMGNLTLFRALQFSGYDVEHVWGHGTHNGNQATQVFPDAMRWLWRDWPQPIKASTQTQNVFLREILQPGEDWTPEEMPGGLKFVFAGKDGKLGFTDALKGPQDQPVEGGCVLNDGTAYLTQSDGKVVKVDPDGKKSVLDEGLDHPTGIAVTPDHLWLAVVESRSHWGYSYQLQPDGTVADKQKFYWLHVPDWAEDSGAGPLCFDRDGRLYCATRMGVQVLDRNGRTRAILPVPSGEVTGICFGGKDNDTLYVVAGGKFFRRTMKARGWQSFEAPIKLPGWGAG